MNGSTSVSRPTRTLVVGGTGMIGAWVARRLLADGHEVTVAARTPPRPDSPVADLGFVTGDYTTGGWEDRLRDFDAMVFVAGQDIRHVGPDATDSTWDQVQGSIAGVFSAARDAGVARAVLVGSYYHLAHPELVATSSYVRARQQTDHDVLALATDRFSVCSVNPPNVVGMIPGRSTKTFAKQVAWAHGQLAGKVPDFGPPGGTNYVSVRTVADAVSGALRCGAPGASYLIGDRNLTFSEYFQLIFDAAGSPRVVVERDEEHPMLPDAYLVAGRGHVLAYEPDLASVELLGYRRNDVEPMLRQMAAEVAT